MADGRFAIAPLARRTDFLRSARLAGGWNLVHGHFACVRVGSISPWLGIDVIADGCIPSLAGIDAIADRLSLIGERLQAIPGHVSPILDRIHAPRDVFITSAGAICDPAVA